MESMSEPKAPTISADDWQRRYLAGDAPWDSGLVSRELRQFVDSGDLAPLAANRTAAIELGCGTGTNAVYLAQQGFTVTAVDFAAEAVERAKARARAAVVDVRFVCGDATKLDDVTGPFDLVFDRACYHCVRRAGQLSGYVKTVERLTQPGARLFILAGNPDAGEAGGPPKVRAAELVGDFERSFRLERLTAFRFEDAAGVAGPLGWSAMFVRR